MLNHPKGNDQPACHSEEWGGRGERGGETGGDGERSLSLLPNR